MVAEDFLDGLGLAYVPYRSRSAVKVDVVDVFRLHLRILKRILHAETRTETFGMCGRDVVGIRAHSASCHFGIYLCAASLGMLKLLEHKRRAAFSDHEAVARTTERARGRRRVIVAGRECLHGIEASHACRIHSRFGTAGHYCVGHSETDIVERIDESVVGRCACRHGGKVRAAEAMVYGYMACSYVGDHLGNEERIVFRPFLLVNSIISRFFLKCVKAAYAGCEYHAYAVFVKVFVVESCIFDCLVGRHQSVHGIQVERPRLLAVEMLFGLEVFHLACKLRLEQACVEMRNRACSADAFFGVAPGRLYIIADGRQRAEAGYYNSFQFHNCAGNMNMLFWFLRADLRSTALIRPPDAAHLPGRERGRDRRKPRRHPLHGASVRLHILFLLLVSLDVCDSVAYSCDLFCFLVRNCDVELLLELHDEFYGVE